MFTFKIRNLSEEKKLKKLLSKDIAMRKSRKINYCFLIIDKVYGSERAGSENYALGMTW